MILGTGIDLVFVPRLERSGRRWGPRFLDRIFTEAEQADCLRRRNPWPALAARFAAKEAFYKAADLDRLHWKDVEVVRSPDGAPQLRLHGGARDLHGRHILHVSLSHDGDYAVAQVLIEREPVSPE